MHSALFRDEQPLRIRCATVTMLLACQCLAPKPMSNHARKTQDYENEDRAHAGNLQSE